MEKFGFIIGVQHRTFRDQDPVNIEASELVARLHDALKASGYVGDDLQLCLVWIVFCLFADNTGIFEPRDIFLQFVEDRTASYGLGRGPHVLAKGLCLRTGACGTPVDALFEDARAIGCGSNKKAQEKWAVVNSADANGLRLAVVG